MGNERKGFVFLVVMFLMIALVSVFNPSAWSWHDWQRIGQISIIFFSSIYLLCCRAGFPLDRQSGVVLSLVFFGGGLSALLSHQPFWAFIEVALVWGCLTLMWSVSWARKISGLRADGVLLTAVGGICLVKVTQFLVAYVAFWIVGEGDLNVYVLLDGFSQPRFYGQFQTLTLPLLALPLLTVRPNKWRYAFFVLLALWWMIAIAGGTRGTWLGMAGAMAFLAIGGAEGRAWVGWQIKAVLMGLGMFLLLFNWLPSYFNVEVVNHSAARLTTSLSSRDLLWLQAWEMIVQRPWVGFGPMHFADIVNSVAAHPHQALLQWAAEWGVPSMLCLSWLLLRTTGTCLSRIRDFSMRQRETFFLELCLVGSICASFIQAMVDGVIVMPNTQLWLAALSGWLLALYSPSFSDRKITGSSQLLLGKVWLCGGIVSALILVMVAFRDIPHLIESQKDYKQVHGGHLQPRFWAQGVIGDYRG